MSELATENTESEPLGSVPDAITGTDEQMIRESVKQLNKQREEQGTLVRDTLVERTWHLSGPTTLKDATSKISDEHKIEVAQDYARGLGITLDDADAKIVGDEAARFGRQPSEMPIYRVPVVNDHGQSVPELRDDEPITRENSFETLSEARRSMRNFRDAQSAQAQALLDELGAQQEEQAEAAQRPAPEPAPAPAPAPPPQQPAIEAERRALAAERQAVAQLQQMGEQEAVLFADIRRHDAAALQAFPELQWGPDQLAQLAQTNPQRFAQISSEYQKNQQARQQLAALTTNRQRAQGQIAQHHQAEATAQRERAFAQHDADFESWLANNYPNYSKGARRNELTAAVKSYLKDGLKMSDQQIRHHYDVTGVLRESAAQKVLADAAMWRIAQANAKNIASRRGPVHQPQVPGVHRPAGSDYEAEIQSVRKQLVARFNQFERI